MSLNFVRLPLKNAGNVRDLGGYACDGGATNWKTFIRADSISALDEEDIRFLLDYGVKTIIDLRTAAEIAAAPDPSRLIEQTSCHHIPLMSGGQGDVKEIFNSPPISLPDLYLATIQQEQPVIKTILETAASAQGALLFHCAAGKDRTGIVAALLLGVAGVSVPDMLANYEVTYTYIRNNPDMIEYANTFPPAFLPTLYSPREYLEPMLEYIAQEHGGIREYLSRIGLSPDTVQRIREKFIQAERA
jgi:protein-tyrosine phosphatase